MIKTEHDFNLEKQMLIHRGKSKVNEQLRAMERSHQVEQRIDYLNSVDTTIMGSRNGQAAIFLWHALRKKGVEGIKAEVTACLDTAGYLRDQLTAAGISCRLNDLSSTVVLERPADENFVRRWQLACEEDIAHVVVMPNVTREKVDVFVAEVVASAAAHGRTTPRRDDSPLAMLADRSWGGELEEVELKGQAEAQAVG